MLRLRPSPYDQQHTPVPHPGRPAALCRRSVTSLISHVSQRSRFIFSTSLSSRRGWEAHLAERGSGHRFGFAALRVHDELKFVLDEAFLSADCASPHAPPRCGRGLRREGQRGELQCGRRGDLEQRHPRREPRSTPTTSAPRRPCGGPRLLRRTLGPWRLSWRRRRSTARW